MPRQVSSLLCLVFIILSFPAFSQLKKKTHHTALTNEEYYEALGVKHGQYIKTRMDAFGSLLVFGSFQKNQSHNDWYYFYPNEFNSLYCRGEYFRGKRIGPWIEYQPLTDTTVIASEGPDAMLRSGLLESNELRKYQKTLVYDTSGQKLLAEGLYLEDEKFGKWKYYDSAGAVLHVYDHSTRKFLQDRSTGNNEVESSFLGGLHRLWLVTQAEFYIHVEKVYRKNSEVKYQISSDNGSAKIQMISTEGDSRFMELIDPIVKSFLSDWIIAENNSIELSLKYILKPLEFGGFQWYMTIELNGKKIQ